MNNILSYNEYRDKVRLLESKIIYDYLDEPIEENIFTNNYREHKANYIVNKTLEEEIELGKQVEEKIKSTMKELSNACQKVNFNNTNGSDFIKRYEWMGTVGSYPTHWFTARWKGHLGGVVIMGMPNAFSKLLGDNTKEIERLIARGASASWTPKNLGTKFLMWCIKWMVNNTQYRLFTAYSDTTCKELGTIYQSLNFFYLGNRSGTNVRCVNPYNPSKLISDRAFRARSFYKRYCKDLGIEYEKNWFGDQSVHWENIPDDIENKLRDYSKEMFRKAEKIEFPSKHKYAFVLGRDKRETKQLRKKFLDMNKTYPYPKERGK